MTWHRRNFLKTTGLTAAALVARPRSVRAMTSRNSTIGADPTPADYKSIVSQAIDAAKRAGAQYADARISYIRQRDWLTLIDREELGIGVRALVNGYWGFASTPYLDTDAVARTAREAVAQAKVNMLGGAHGATELAPAPVVTNGHWAGPCEIDPFDVQIEDVLDWTEGMSNFIQHDLMGLYPNLVFQSGFVGLAADRTEKVFASTEGSFMQQTFYQTVATFQISAFGFTLPLDCFKNRAGGWELVINAPIIEDARKTLASMRAASVLPRRGTDVGRYDLVIDAPATAAILNGTIAAAAQIDRAMGYEANAGGTSYLGPDPFALLGTSIASPLISITANRSMPNGLATTHWDDEGVAPDEFPLVSDGVLVDYQTTREQATWLAPWYQKHGKPVQSHGCANTRSALNWTVQQTPNIAMTPGKEDLGVEDFIASMSHGVFVQGGAAFMDFQCLNGLGIPGLAYEIKNGRRVGIFNAAGFLFRAPEFWKNLSAIGGKKSFEWTSDGESYKGEPRQKGVFTTGTVPIVAKNIAVIDVTRRA